MRSRGPVPGPLVVMIVAAALPEILRRCKPLAKTIADTLVKAGEVVHRMAETDQPEVAPATEGGTVTSEDAPNPDVKEETTKAGAGTAQVDLETASPTGHEEIASQIAAEAKGDGAATEPVTPRPRKAKKPVEPSQPQNPKRTKNSRAS